MSDTANKTQESKEGVPGYTSTKVGDHTVITPDDKKTNVYQKVTTRESYKVARDVANRAINEINAIRANRPSSFTGGINDANIAARMQAAETYGNTLPGGRGYSRSRKAAYDIADSYRKTLETSRKPVSKPTPRIPEPTPTPTPRPSDPTVRGPKKPTHDPSKEPDYLRPVLLGETKTPEAAPNMSLTEDPNWDKSIGYAPKSFGVGPEYDKYTKMFQRQIDEGSTLEQAMRLSRTATPEDFLKAFGDQSMWKKWGGGNKGGSSGAGHKSKNKAHTAAAKAGIAKANKLSGWMGGPCDIRLKTDIAPLMSTEINDDLAELAFFVKELQVK